MERSKEEARPLGETQAKEADQRMAGQQSNAMTRPTKVAEWTGVWTSGSMDDSMNEEMNKISTHLSKPELRGAD